MAQGASEVGAHYDGEAEEEGAHCWPAAVDDGVFGEDFVVPFQEEGGPGG